MDTWCVLAKGPKHEYLYNERQDYHTLDGVTYNNPDTSYIEAFEIWLNGGFSFIDRNLLDQFMEDKDDL